MTLEQILNNNLYNKYINRPKKYFGGTGPIVNGEPYNGFHLPTFNETVAAIKRKTEPINKNAKTFQKKLDKAYRHFRKSSRSVTELKNTPYHPDEDIVFIPQRVEPIAATGSNWMGVKEYPAHTENMLEHLGFINMGNYNQPHTYMDKDRMRTVKDNSGAYYIINDKGEFVDNCAEAANLFDSRLGMPTTGNAWTRQGLYGDSLVYGAQNGLIRNGNETLATVAAEAPAVIRALQAQINPRNLKTGDVVDLFSPTSVHVEEALAGRGNSHTGTIYKTSDGSTYVFHNVAGYNRMEPLGKFTDNENPKWGITRISRVGTINHQYDANGKPITTQVPTEQELQKQHRKFSVAGYNPYQFMFDEKFKIQ